MHNIQFEKILVEKLIKQSSLEKTHIVYLSLTDGSRIGPFIRKIITKESGLGKTYKLLFDSQNNDFSNLHVPNIYYYKEGKDAIEIIEENIDGVNLAQFCEKHITENEAIKIAISLSDAVTYLHENFSPSIIHRDIKPENIVISRKNSNGEAELSATLIDFGIARAFDEKADNDTRAFGTRGYAPPEQFGFAQTNERSDIYSLGKVIEFLFGKVEQKGSSVSSDQAPNNSDFVKLTNVIVNKACAFDPKDRFSSAKEITQILNAYLDGQKIDVVELHNSTTNNTKSILGILYNAAVIFCFVWLSICNVAVMLLDGGTSLNTITTESKAMQNPILAFIIIEFFILLPAFILLFYKKPLYKRWPNLPKFSAKHRVIIIVVSIIAILVILMISEIIARL